MLKAARAGERFSLVLLDGMMPGMTGFAVAEEIRDHPLLSGGTVMMLSSAMTSGAAARCAELGVASHLTKPISQSELLEAILIAIGVSGEEPPPLAATSDREASGLHILLAEDNPINRSVAAGILEKRGHSLVHAANGHEAVAAAVSEVFDLIFMDVQMPEMDGFEATRMIRESEKRSGRHAKIVAMTAYAMAGDRERCLAAGMDDYIAKPLQTPELIALLARNSPWPTTTDPRSGSAIFKSPYGLVGSDDGALAAASIFTREKLMDQFDGDPTLMRKLIALFHENAPNLLEEMRRSIAQGMPDDLACSAHTFLGSLGVFGATRARRLTLQLEEQGRSETLEGSIATLGELERETELVSLALEKLVASEDGALSTTP